MKSPEGREVAWFNFGFPYPTLEPGTPSCPRGVSSPRVTPGQAGLSPTGWEEETGGAVVGDCPPALTRRRDCQCSVRNKSQLEASERPSPFCDSSE